MLGEIADAQVLRRHALGRAAARVTPASSLISVDLPAPLGPEQTDALARRQAEFDAVDYRRCAVAGRHRAQAQQRIGQFLRRAQAEVKRRVDMRRGDQLHALQGLQSALGLARLGGLGAEALDEGVHVRDLALLLFVLRLLTGQALPRAGVRTPSSCRCKA